MPRGASEQEAGGPHPARPSETSWPNLSSDQAHTAADQVARTVRRLMYVMLFTGTYLVITIAVPDWKLVRADADIPLAVAGQAAGIEVELSIFLTFAPLILIALLIYLHLFVGQMALLERQGIEAPATYVFTMRRPATQAASDLILYGFVPAVLAWLTWKTVFRDEAPFLAVTTAVVAASSAGLLLARARMGNDARRGAIALAALALIGLATMASALGLLVFGWDQLLQWRRIDLVRADLGVSKETPYVDLRGLDLRHADARFAVLAGADLRRARLDHADLTEADLSRADLSDAGLRHAKLAAATLDEATLQGANMNRADLRQASMIKTKLAEARLVAATLTRVKVDGADLSGADLHGADLRRAAFTGTYFAEADLRNVEAVLAEFKESSFGAADLTGANLEEADVTGSLFSLARLSNANFKLAQGLEKDKLTGATLCGTVMPDGSLNNDGCRGEQAPRCAKP